MKFTKQLNKWDCAPTAIANAIKYTTGKYSYKDNYKKLVKLLDCKPKIGTLPIVFTYLLKNYKFPFKINKIIVKPKLKLLRHYIENNNIAIIGVDYKGYSHVGLLIRITPKYMYLVNWGKGKTVKKITVEKFYKFIQYWSIAYFIEKSNETKIL